MSYKEFVCKIYNKYSKLNNKKTNISIRNGQSFWTELQREYMDDK